MGAVGCTAVALLGIFCVACGCGFIPRDFIKLVNCSGISANTCEIQNKVKLLLLILVRMKRSIVITLMSLAISFVFGMMKPTQSNNNQN